MAEISTPKLAVLCFVLIAALAGLAESGFSVEQVEADRITAGMPPISLHHLQTLTDTNGIHEFAHGTIPWHENGYCAEDVARALVAVTQYEKNHRQNECAAVGQYLFALFAKQFVRGRPALEPARPDADQWRLLWPGSVGAGLCGGDASGSKKSPRLPQNFWNGFCPAYNEKLGGYPIANACAIQGLTAFIRKFPGGAPQVALEKSCAAKSRALPPAPQRRLEMV